MTRKESSTCKPGDRIEFKSGRLRGRVATITAVERKQTPVTPKNVLVTWMQEGAVYAGNSWAEHVLLTEVSSDLH